jgi:hypothetical protein
MMAVYDRKCVSCTMDGAIDCEDCIDYTSINRFSNMLFYLNETNAARNSCHGISFNSYFI